MIRAALGSLLAALTGALPCVAQDATYRLQRVVWPLMDFAVLGDTINGTQLVVSPNLRSVQGRQDGGEYLVLVLEPAEARRWANGVAGVVEAVSAVPRADRVPFQSIPLAGNRGRARIVVSLERDAPRATPFVFLVWDSVASKGWTVKATSDDLRALFTAIESVATTSVLDSASRGVGGTPFLECELDEPPRGPERYQLMYPLRALRDRKQGRVLASYVVDSTGAVPVDSLRIVWTDGKSFAQAAQHALTRATYAPGRREGRPVTTRVWSWFVFRIKP